MKKKTWKIIIAVSILITCFVLGRSYLMQLGWIENPSPPLFQKSFSSAITALAVSHDGKTIAVGQAYGNITLLNASNFEEITTISRLLDDGYTDGIEYLSFSKSDRLLISAFSTGTLGIWDLTSKPISGKFLEQKEGPLIYCDCLPSEDRVIFALETWIGADEELVRVALADINTLKIIKSVELPQDTGPFELSPDGSRFIYYPCGFFDKEVAECDVESLTPIRKYGNFGPFRSSISYSPDGTTVALNSGDDPASQSRGEIVTLNLSNEKRTVICPFAKIVKFDSTGQFLLVANERAVTLNPLQFSAGFGGARIVRMSDHKVLKSVEVGRQAKCAAVFPSINRAVVGGETAGEEGILVVIDW